MHTNSSNESNVIKLEDRANDYPTDASAQEQYLKASITRDIVLYDTNQGYCIVLILTRDIVLY